MIVTPAHKKGSKIDPLNYRAVSLLSFPGKVFSHILLQRINQHSEEFIEENQFEFRPNRGTVYAIIIIQQIVEKAEDAR